jgi:hypothetical protein
LEKVVMQTLASDPEKRFRSLLELGSALLPFASEKVRLTIGEAFRQTPVTVVLPAVDASQPYQAPPPRPPSTPSALHPGATRILPTGEEPRMVKVRRPPSSRRTTEPVPRLTPPSLLSRGLTTGAILAGVVLVGTVLWVLLRKPALPTVQKTVLTAEPLPEEKSGPVPPALRRIDIATIPTSARISLDNGSPESGELHTTLPSDGESHVLRIWAQGYESRIISFGPDDRLPTQVHLDPVAKQAVVEQRPPIASPHKPAKTRHAAQAPDNSTGKEASDLKRGVNGALILE